MKQQTQFYVFANGIRIHYLEFGFAGPLLLIIPGITSPAATWDFVAERLAANFHVYVMDVRGRGLSEHRPGMGYKIDDYAADASAMLDALDLESAYILGHSLGAKVAARLASHYVSRVSRLVMVDPAMTGIGRKPYPRSSDFYINALRAAERGESINAPSHWTSEQVNKRTEWLPTCSEEAIVASLDASNEPSIHSDCAKLSCPSLLLCADRGGVVSDQDLDEIRVHNSNIKIHRMTNVGHMVPWDDLDQFISMVMDFLLTPEE